MKQKVLMLVDALHIVNGVSVSARELADYWGERDWQLYVYGTGHGKPEHHHLGSATLRLATNPIPIPLVVYQGLHLSFPVLKTWLALRETRGGIIHTLTPGPLGMRGFWYAWLNRMPFIITHFTRMTVYADLYIGRRANQAVENILRTMYAHSTLVIAHSPGSAEEAYELGAKKVTTIPVGVPVPYRTPDQLLAERKRARASLTRKLNLDPDQPILLYVGRLSIEKSLEAVLQAAEELNLPLIVAGDGPLRPQVEAAPCAILLGMLHGQELIDLYLAADLFASASITETVGRVFLESLAYGTPIVVPDCGQHNTLLPSECPAIFKYPRAETDPAVPHLVGSIRRALQNRDAQTLAREALYFALSFSWENVIPEHIALYEEVLAAHDSRKLNGRARQELP